MVEVPVNMPSTGPFDLLRIVEAFLWEDPRIDQAERAALTDLCLELLGQLGSVAGKKSSRPSWTRALFCDHA